MKHFLNWLRRRFSQPPPPVRPDFRQSAVHLRKSGRISPVPRRPSPAAAPKRQPEFVELDPRLEGQIEDAGPGKNVLIRNKYKREDTGTHETLTILDDSMLDSEEEAGIDPYNTGRFDRSKNWDKRFRN